MSNEATPSVQAAATGAAGSGSIASFIDHTLLKPEASEADVLKVCAEAAEYGFKSVCVNPIWVKTVKKALKGSGVLTCSVVGFPLGATPTDVKTFEARGAVLDGADEVDILYDGATHEQHMECIRLLGEVVQPAVAHLPEHDHPLALASR